MAGCDRRRWIDRAFLWSFYFIRFRNLTYFGLWFFSLFFSTKDNQIINENDIQTKDSANDLVLKLDVG